MAKKKAIDNISFKKSGYKFRDRQNISKKTEIPQKSKPKSLDKNNQSKNSSKSKDIDEIINPFFILEKYILYDRIRIIKKIELANQSEKLNISINLMLQNLFLKKFRLDPGFRFTIYTEMESNSKILRQVYRELLSFFQDPVIFGNLINSVKFKNSELESFEERIQIHRRTEGGFLSLFKSAFLSNKNKEYWFYQLWRYYMEKGQVNEATAVESMLLDFYTGYYHGYFLFSILNLKSDEMNAYYYLLKGIKDLVENVDSYFLDFTEAHCRNILLCEKLQKVIDSFNYNELKKFSSDLIKHLQDILSVELNFLNISSIYSAIYTIAAVIFFNSLPFQDKIKRLNQFFGIKTIFQELEKNQTLYDKSVLIADFPIWKEYYLLPNLNPIINDFVEDFETDESMETKTNEVNDYFILIKYLCLSLIEQNLYNEAFQILSQKFSIIFDWIDLLKRDKEELKTLLDADNHLNIELIYLLGIIAVGSENKTLFKFIIYLLNILIEKVEKTYLKVKLIVIKSILYRKKKLFHNEEIILNSIEINYEEFRKSKDANPFEIMHTFVPPIELYAEDQSDLKRQKVMNEIETAIFMEREPLIPILPESYVIYSQIRKMFFNKVKDTEARKIVEDLYELRKLDLACQKAQSLASFELAISISEKIKINKIYGLENEEMRILMETIAFPYYYSKKIEEFEKYLNNALVYNPDDKYYDEYKVLINLINQKYEIASEILFKFYTQGASGKYPYLKSTYQHIIFYFKEKDFENILESLLNTNMAGEFAKNIDKIYCDVGFAFADLGYFEKAISYFNKAIEYTPDSSSKAAFIGNIGTVYSDQGQYKNAIIQFEEAKNIDRENPQHWFSLGKMYQLQNNYVKAKDVYDKAIENFKEDIRLTKEFIILSVLMDVYNKETVNLNSVHDKVAKDHLKQAQQLVRNINNLETLTNNTGIIFIALNNGFDSYFHSTFSKLFLRGLQKKYSNYTRLPPEIWKTFPNGIKNIWNGKNMFLGQIIDLFKDFLNKSADPSIKMIKEMIPNSISNKDIRAVKDFAKLSSETRNPGSHGRILDKNVFSSYINNYIDSLNRVIIILEKVYNSLN